MKEKLALVKLFWLSSCMYTYRSPDLLLLSNHATMQPYITSLGNWKPLMKKQIFSYVHTLNRYNCKKMYPEIPFFT